MLVNSLAWGVALAVLSQTSSFKVAMPFLFLIGFISAVCMSLNMTLMQIYSAPEMRGRVSSIGMMTFGGGGSAVTIETAYDVGLRPANFTDIGGKVQRTVAEVVSYNRNGQSVYVATQ